MHAGAFVVVYFSIVAKTDIRRSMADLPALKAGMSLVAALRANASRLHKATDPIMAACFPGILHAPGDVPIAIRKTTFNSELLDLAKKTFVFYCALAVRLPEPGIKTTWLYLQYTAHRCY